MKKEITLAITGASGAIYADTLLAALIKADCRVYLLISKAAQVVFNTELGLAWPQGELAQVLMDRYQSKAQQLQLLESDDWFSPVASGSGAPKQMVVCPCSMGTLAAIAHGMSDNLIERAADVMLKERGQLLLVPREMPYSQIHLENMLTLSRLGAELLPASPGFYHQPKSIQDLVDHVVARILDRLNIAHTLSARWGRD